MHGFEIRKGGTEFIKAAIGIGVQQMVQRLAT